MVLWEVAVHLPRRPEILLGHLVFLYHHPPGSFLIVRRGGAHAWLLTSLQGVKSQLQVDGIVLKAFLWVVCLVRPAAKEVIHVAEHVEIFGERQVITNGPSELKRSFQDPSVSQLKVPPKEG